MRLIILGPPAAGKGTQAKRLAQRLQVPHLSSGELLREAAASGSELGELIGDIMKRGELVPDEIVKGIVAKRATEPDAANGFILDGYPRNLEQAQSLDRAFAAHGIELDAVLEITVDEEVLVERVANRAKQAAEEGTEARADDKPDVLRDRIRAYRSATVPLTKFYDERELLESVDGTQSIDAVTADLVAALA